jgi:hypothetical protein
VGRSTEDTSLSRKDTIPLYSINGNFIRHVRAAEAFALESDGAVYLTFAGKRDTLPSAARLLDARRESGTLNPKAGISPSEMEANAGLFGSSHTARLPEAKKTEIERSGRQPEDFVERTFAKVLEWGKSQYRFAPHRG